MENVRKKILLIDDDMNFLITVREILENEGYEVFTNDSWFGATNLVKKIHPDLVLLDINMPGLSGIKLSGLIQTNGNAKHLPILFHSSNDEDGLRRTVAETGVDGYVCKGNVPDLIKKVAFYLNRQ